MTVEILNLWGDEPGDFLLFGDESGDLILWGDNGTPPPVTATHDTAGDIATPDEIRRMQRAIRDREKAKALSDREKRKADKRLRDLIARVYGRIVDKEPDAAAELVAAIAPAVTQATVPLPSAALREALAGPVLDKAGEFVGILQRLQMERAARPVAPIVPKAVLPAQDERVAAQVAEMQREAIAAAEALAQDEDDIETLILMVI